jgi:hypothetical protein
MPAHATGAARRSPSSRALGYRQQVNRLRPHPLRLAINVVVADDGTESLGGAWAHRQNPEGVYSAAKPEWARPTVTRVARSLLLLP